MIQKCGDTTPRWKLHMLLTRLHRLTILLREVSFWGVAPIFHQPSLFWKPLQPSVACAESMMTLRHSDVNRSSIYIRFLSVLAAIRAISHLVDDFMSFPVGGGRYQSGALHTMGLRRYNWRPNIQWSPPAPLCNCPLTLLPLIFLQPFMCLIVFVSTAGLSVLF